jgi:methionyl-tRNA formyltransferase
MESKIKIAFIGGTHRALRTFEAFLTFDNIEICCAIFMEGHENEKEHAHALGKLAEEQGIPFVIQDKISDTVIELVKQNSPDVIIGGGIWRALIGNEFFELARFGMIGLHGTALPAYRGMAGINWQIINGHSEIKMRMFQLSDGIDDGPLIGDLNGNILECRIDIENEKHLEEIFAEYEQKHLQSYKDLFQLMHDQQMQFYPQNESEATYACHRGPEDAELDWSKCSREIFDLIRSQSKPYGGAHTYYNGNKVTVWRSRIRPEFSNYQGRIPGKVVERDASDNSVVILTADSAVQVYEAQAGDEHAVVKIFSSIRMKCKSKVEAVADKVNKQFSFFE